ncbi:MAG: tyrosine--tRNA ligase [Candidatus Pacebacteria bacterium]|nr:tyrosine--tRNA ligase [Candidatus Paceibacterota bacterium]
MKQELSNELLSRGVSSIYPSFDFVKSKIDKGEKVTIYLGVDPTGPTLHLGHAIPLKKLSEFQKLGHKIILLMGDFTAMIGDPTDKSATRKQLTHKEVLNNLKNYKKQAGKLISFSGKNKAVIKFNSKWLGKMSFAEVLSLASHMTVQQMLERDMFKKREEEGKPIYLHEFLYPLMQGYDSVAMDVDGEIGGNDQTFNMLCGRDLMKGLKNKEKFVITMKLLEDNSGKKMGKTEGNMVSLSDSPKEMYGKIMSWTDSLIIPGFELCTFVEKKEIEEIVKSLAKGLNPRDLKMRLAQEVVKIYHGELKAKEAEQNFIKTFQKNEIPNSLEEIKGKGSLAMVLLVSKKIKSMSEWRRLVDGGAITAMETGEKIKKYDFLAKPGVYKIGKKRFVKII